MKAPVKLFTIALLLLFLFGSCAKTATSLKTYTVTENDAATVIANNILPLYGGFTNSVNCGMVILARRSQYCGVNIDSTANGASRTGAVITYQYQLGWHYIDDCAGTLTATINGKGSYEGSNFAGDGQVTANLQIIRTNTSSSNVEANWSTTGSQRIKNQEGAVFTADLLFKDVKLTVDKLTSRILNGTATVTIAGKTNSNNFNYAGTIQFDSYNKARITLNSGTVYPISW